MEGGGFKGHVLLMPFPAQGHINPVLQFAKRLSSKGLKATLIITIFARKNLHLQDSNLAIETISDGYDETGPYGAESGLVYFNSFKEVGSRTLGEIINKYNKKNMMITCLVSDAIIPWGLDVGKAFGLVTASFYTQTCSVSSIFYEISQGNLSVPVKEATVSLPGLPLLALEDLPSCIVKLEDGVVNALTVLKSQFSNVENADWLFFNVFDDLEPQALELMKKRWKVRTIGPTTLSMYLEKRMECDYKNNLNMFKRTESKYMKWLDSKEPRSVVYISFGSLAEVPEKQMEELTQGIKQSNRDFLWVVRESKQSKLPTKFSEEIVDKGFLVTWCSQLEVLAHKAIGCFLTHCGWNSTIEALSLGVPMVAIPLLRDQLTNAKFVEDVWGLGIRAKKDEKGVVTREEFEFCIREVMEGEKAKVIKMNVIKWRELAKTAADEGGSSDLNVQEFVANVTYT